MVLNDGDASADTELKATLKRAAAKIVVRIRKGEKVEFSNESGAGEAGYYLRNMPYTTSVISGVDADAELWTPGRNASSYFHWTADVVTVTAYAYSHDWANQSALEKETRLIVNVPLYPLDKEGNRGEFQPRSYYQIPVSKSKNLLRNHLLSSGRYGECGGCDRPFGGARTRSHRIFGERMGRRDDRRGRRDGTSDISDREYRRDGDV